jgi:hypothetical protein
MNPLYAFQSFGGFAPLFRDYLSLISRSLSSFYFLFLFSLCLFWIYLFFD